MRDKKVYDETVSTKGHLVVYFHSYDAKECKDLAKDYKQFAKTERFDIQFCIVDIDENEESVKELGIKAAPYFIIYKDGSIIERIEDETDWQQIKGKI